MLSFFPRSATFQVWTENKNATKTQCLQNYPREKRKNQGLGESGVNIIHGSSVIILKNYVVVFGPDFQRAFIIFINKTEATV